MPKRIVRFPKWKSSIQDEEQVQSSISTDKNCGKYVSMYCFLNELFVNAWRLCWLKLVLMVLVQPGQVHSGIYVVCLLFLLGVVRLLPKFPRIPFLFICEGVFIREELRPSSRWVSATLKENTTFIYLFYLQLPNYSYRQPLKTLQHTKWIQRNHHKNINVQSLM